MPLCGHRSQTGNVRSLSSFLPRWTDSLSFAGMADTASLRAPLCTEQFGSGAPRSCSAAADGSLQWDRAQRWGWFSRASITKPGQHEGGGRGPWAALTTLSGLRSVLLPQGFPDSVSPDYLQYQLWDSVQVRLAYCHGGWRAYDWGPRE